MDLDSLVLGSFRAVIFLCWFSTVVNFLSTHVPFKCQKCSDIHSANAHKFFLVQNSLTFFKPEEISGGECKNRRLSLVLSAIAAFCF